MSLGSATADSAGHHRLLGSGRVLSLSAMEQRSSIVDFCRRLADSRAFHIVILAVILANAVVVGLETSDELVLRFRPVFAALHAAVLAIFVAEMAIRIAAHGSRLLGFLRDGWNLFDFVVVALSLVPGVGAFTTVARIARVLRVVRLVSVSPKLRLIVGTMTRSIPSLGHVSLLLSLLLYLYAVIGVNLFAAADPGHWSSLGAGLLTLFQILTLEGWVEVQGAVTRDHPWAWIYFASFVVVAVFVVVNLFIAVVLNNLDEIREEDRLAARAAKEAEEAERNRHLLTTDRFEQHLRNIRAELEHLEAMHRRMKDEAAGTGA